METFGFRAMNTDILLLAEGMPFRLAEGFEKSRQFMEECEARFSRFLEGSELSRLNRSAGSRFTASPELFTVVRAAMQFFHKTHGLFDPSILPDLRRVGYDRSMDLVREQGPGPLLESILASERPPFSSVELDERDNGILLPAGMALDLGGIAKGWITEQTAQRLSTYATACAVNAGGDMYLAGLPEGKEWWPVELEDPYDPSLTLTSLKAGPGAVATSAVTKRTWMQGGIRRHHLIDPRTGEPAETDWLSVTVFAPHADEAEVYAKALLIAGPQHAEELIQNGASHLRYLAVDREKKIWGTHNSLEQVYVDRSSSVIQ